MLGIGDLAPVFTAESTAGRINLKEWLGVSPIVLIFYPKDFTPGCTKQLCAVRDSKALYAKHNATVLAVNAGTLEEHRAFAEKHGYDFPIVADEEGTIRKAYGVGKILGMFLQHRTVFIIGADGKIAYAEKGSPSTDEIIGVLTRRSCKTPKKTGAAPGNST